MANNPILKRFDPAQERPAPWHAMHWNATRCGLNTTSPDAWGSDTLYEPSDGQAQYRFVRVLLEQLGDQWVARLPSPIGADGLDTGTTVMITDPRDERAPAWIAQIRAGEWLDPEAVA